MGQTDGRTDTRPFQRPRSAHAVGSADGDFKLETVVGLSVAGTAFIEPRDDRCTRPVVSHTPRYTRL